MTMEQVLALSGSKEPLKMTYEFAFLFSSIVVSASPRIRSESTPIFSPPSCPVLLPFSLSLLTRSAAPRALPHPRRCHAVLRLCPVASRRCSLRLRRIRGQKAAASQIQGANAPSIQEEAARIRRHRAAPRAPHPLKRARAPHPFHVSTFLACNAGIRR